MEFKQTYGIMAHTSSILHFLEDDVDVLSASTYAGTKGMGTSKLDAVYYGYIPNSFTGNPAAPFSKVYVPPVGSDEFNQLLDFLSQGGVLILSATHEAASFISEQEANIAELQALAADRAKLNSFLYAIGSKASVASVSEESARTGVDVKSMQLMYPRNAAWSYNPDTWLTSGMPLANRVVTYSTARMIADANRQNGIPSYYGYDKTKTYNITDLTGGANAGIDYLRTHNVPYRNGPGFSPEYPGMNQLNGPINRTESITYNTYGANQYNKVLLRTTDVQGTALMCMPMCNAVGRIDTNSLSGWTYSAGPNRYLNIKAVAEVLPNGGRVLTIGWVPLGSTYYGSVVQSQWQTNQFIMALMKKKLQPSCTYLSEGLRSLYV
jgi:hypothetical protein